MSTRRAARARAACGRMAALLTAIGAASVARTAGAAAPTSEASDEATARALAHAETRLSALAGKPEQVGPLVELLELAELLPPERLDAPVGAVMTDGATDPLVAARARDWLASRADATGDTTAAEELRRPLGLLSRVWVVGPFGDGRASFGVGFPPETETDRPEPGRLYPGKEHDVSWRRADGAFYRGRLHLDALLRPDSDAAAYLVAWVRSPVAVEAALRLGTAGPAKVWCNGALAFAADRARSARFDQDAVGIELRAGWNRLLVKTVVTQGSWQVAARLTTPAGGALTFDNDWAPEQVPPHARAGAVPVRSLEAILRDDALRAPPGQAAADAWLDLGRYLLAVDPADRDVQAPVQAFE
ncbi:MAG TPA: hypothetical protein VGP07_19900, partial [Polyangia bacterium]